MKVTRDLSNGAECVLIIREHHNDKTMEILFDATDEQSITDYYWNTELSETLHNVSGSPLLMEIAGWSYVHAGEEAEYDISDYFGDRYEIELTVIDE